MPQQFTKTFFTLFLLCFSFFFISFIDTLFTDIIHISCQDNSMKAMCMLFECSLL